MYFFFQAEDGIRDSSVTGVQTCALPISYAVIDLTEYTEDLTGNERGRFYGGGGLRSSIPFTRLYPDVQSDLLNLNGINHKIVLSSNYYVTHSDTSVTRLPQLDPLNDDATDQSLRDIKPR